MNVVFFIIVLSAFLVAGYRQIIWVPEGPDAVSPIQALATGMMDTTKIILGRTGARTRNAARADPL